MGMRFFCCNGRHDVEKQVAEQRAQIEILNAHGIQRSPLPLLHAEEVPIPVSLNVYSLTERNKKLAKLGIGVFHTGVVVYGIEWGYGEAMDSPNSSGLFCVTPGHAAGSLYKSIRIGHTTKTPAQVDTILHRMENEWRSNEYHILHHNCNHFAQALCDALSNGTNKLVVPAWCNRAARLSDKILPKKLATKVQRMLDDEPPHAVPAAARPSNIADIPISVIPRHWYLQPNIYPSSRDRTLMSYRNASTMTTTSTDVPAPGAHAPTSSTAQAKHSPVPTTTATTPPATHEEHHTHHHTHTSDVVAAAQLVPAAKPSAPAVQAADHVAAPPPPQPPLRTPRAVADEVAVPHAAPKKATTTTTNINKNGGVPDTSKRANTTLSPLPQALSPSPPAPGTTATTATITTPVITTAMSDGLGVVYSPVSGHGGEDNDETTRLASSNTPSETPRHEKKQKTHSPAVVSLTSQLRAITEELHQATATTPITHQLSEAEPRRLSAEAVSSPASEKTKASLQPTPVTPPMADLPRTTSSPVKAEVNSDTKDVPSRFVRTQLLAQAVTVGTPKSTATTPKALPTMVPAVLPSPRAPPLASSPVVHSLASSSVSSSSLHSSVSWVAKHAKASPSGKKNEAMSPPFMDMARGRQTNIAALVKYGTPVATPRSPVMAQTLPRMQCVSHDEGFAQTTKAEQSTRGQQQKELGGFTVAAALRNASPRPRLRRSASDSDMYVQRNRSRCGPTAPQPAKDVDTTTAAALQQQALSHEQQAQQACNRQVQSARQSPHAPGFTGHSVLFTHVYELHSAPTPAAQAAPAAHKSPIHATELVEEITGFVKPYSASDEEYEDSMEGRRGTGHEGQGCAVKTSSGTERSARLLLSQRPRLSTSSSSRGHSQRRQKQRSEIVSPMTDRLLSSPASARLAVQQTPPPQHRHTAAPASPNGHLSTTTTPLKASPRGAVFAYSTPCRTSPEPHTHHHHNHHENASGSRGRDTVVLSSSASRERNEASMTVTPGVVLSLPLSPTAESVLTPPLKSSVPASLKSDKHRRKADNKDDEEDVELTTTTTESERSIASAP